MDVKFINPILESIVEVVEQIAQVSVNPGKPEVKKDQMARGYISSIMHLSGKTATVSLAISFQEQVIRGIAGNIFSGETQQSRGILADLSGEIANTIAGEVQRKLEALNYTLDMSLPIIMYGPDHVIVHRAQGATVLLPFSTEVGGFYVEVCYEK